MGTKGKELSPPSFVTDFIVDFLLQFCAQYYIALELERDVYYTRELGQFKLLDKVTLWPAFVLLSIHLNQLNVLMIELCKSRWPSVFYTGIILVLSL